MVTDTNTTITPSRESSDERSPREYYYDKSNIEKFTWKLSLKLKETYTYINYYYFRIDTLTKIRLNKDPKFVLFTKNYKH